LSQELTSTPEVEKSKSMKSKSPQKIDLIGIFCIFFLKLSELEDVSPSLKRKKPESKGIFLKLIFLTKIQAHLFLQKRRNKRKAKRRKNHKRRNPKK